MFVFWALLFLVTYAVCEDHLAFACGGTEFSCSDGTCIEKSEWCDTEVNCKDGSDENYCFSSSYIRPNPNNCSESFFMCKDGPCIPLVGRCDGYRSCHDNSDEEGCGTTENTLNETEVPIEQTIKVMDIKQNGTEIPIFTTFYHAMGTEDDGTGYNYVNDAHNFQADSASSKNRSEEKDIEQGYIEMDARDFRRERAEAQRWLLKVREQDYGWGDETARALTALYMSDDDSPRKQYDGKMLMSKQLHLKLFTALIRNRTAPIPLGEMSLFINALSASCENPRNFYGQDLIGILRQRTDLAQGSSTLISPLVYLTLCLNGATTYADARKIQEIIYGTPKIDEIDTEALVSLAATCISRKPKFASYSTGRHIATYIYNKIARRGLPDNIYQLSLVTQALNEARVNQDLWNRTQVLHLITRHQVADGSFGDILSTYYTMPILSGKSLLSLGQQCDTNKDTGLTPLEVLKNGEDEKIYVRYSLNFGNPVEVTHSLIMKVKKSTNFLDIMRMAEETNPVYKFRYDLSRGKPTVYSIGGVVDDPERGLYWKLNVTSQQNSTNVKSIPYEDDIRSFYPTAEDFIVFWIKSLY